MLAKKAAEAGVIYSLAFGDQPALICDLVDWARTCGFPVTAAGRGHKWLPHFSESTPETVWGNYGLTPEQAERGGLNPKMFDSFLDGSKLVDRIDRRRQRDRRDRAEQRPALSAGDVEDIPFVTPPISEGGVLERKGMVEVISSLEANGRQILTTSAWASGSRSKARPSTSATASRNTTPTPTPPAATSRSQGWHLIGLEVGTSVASVALRGEAAALRPAGTPTSSPPPSRPAARRAARRRRRRPGVGEAPPAKTSTRLGGLPLGLAHDVKVVRPVQKGQSLSWSDVAMDIDAGLQDAARDGVAVRRAAVEDGVIDLVFRDALVVDGRGGTPFRGDVAVDRGRVAAVGARLDVDAARTIAADGLALMPGIVDSHTHFDAQITWDPTLSPSPALGVTTAVIGNWASRSRRAGPPIAS